MKRPRFSVNRRQPVSDLIAGLTGATAGAPQSMGNLTQYVSNAVTTGFIERVALPALAGKCGGKLILTGVDEKLYRELERANALDKLDKRALFASTPVIFESMEQGLADAHALKNGQS